MEMEDAIPSPTQASSKISLASGGLLSRHIGGIEVEDKDLDCLRYPQEQINRSVMNAYVILVSKKQHDSLTRAGYVIISSLVPNLVLGKTSCGTTLENIVSVITTRKMLNSRRWAFPLCQESPPHWVLGWVDWSTHEIGLFDSLGIYPIWAQKDLQYAAAGLEHWIKYGTYPEIKSLEQRFKDWRFHYHTLPDGQIKKDDWSCGLFVMMAIDGLANLDFSCVQRSKLTSTKTSALKAIQKIRRNIEQHRSTKYCIPPSLADQAKSSSSFINNNIKNDCVLGTSGSEKVQEVLKIILNSKNLVVICGPGLSVPTRPSCQSPVDSFESLLPIIWQDQTQSSSVFQAMMHHLKRVPIKNLFYQAIHSLDRRGNLLRVYTQNIDAKEKTAGVLSFGVPKSFQIGRPDCPRCIPLLGRLDQMSCTFCSHVVSSTILLDQAPSDGLPICAHCQSRPRSYGHHGIRRPNIVVCKEEQPDLNSILAYDGNLVDVVLAVGVQPIPHSNLVDITKQITKAAQSKAQPGIPSSIMINLNMPALEKTGIQDLFQVSLALDLQDLFKHIVIAAYQDAIHNPASNTMLIPRRFVLNDDQAEKGEEEGEEKEKGGEDGNGNELLLTLTPWYFPVL